MKAPGIANPQSMQEVIFGRPGVENKRGMRAKSVSAAGVKTDPDLQRVEGISILSARWTSSTLRVGDAPPAEAAQETGFEDYAGRKAQSARQCSSNLRSVSAVDKLLYGRDLSQAKQDALVQYANKYVPGQAK
ncbi:Uncharacterized protein SCF082_LOCUS47372 [Durusdinium trenchii]|uniref:Uncharacterized protein n=1 Tax=Durusdinium trenchii TaxID=1381693 RepID=A0ABP0RKS0_9DINO